MFKFLFPGRAYLLIKYIYKNLHQYCCPFDLFCSILAGLIEVSYFYIFWFCVLFVYFSILGMYLCFCSNPTDERLLIHRHVHHIEICNIDSYQLNSTAMCVCVKIKLIRRPTPIFKLNTATVFFPPYKPLQTALLKIFGNHQNHTLFDKRITSVKSFFTALQDPSVFWKWIFARVNKRTDVIAVIKRM